MNVLFSVYVFAYFEKARAWDKCTKAAILNMRARVFINYIIHIYIICTRI